MGSRNQFLLRMFFTWTSIGSGFVGKIPQIFMVEKTNGVAGYSLFAVFVELIGHLIFVSFHILNKSQPAEYFGQMTSSFQNLVLIFVSLYYLNELSPEKIFPIVALMGLFFLHILELVPFNTHILFLMKFTGLIYSLSKIIQINKMWSQMNAECVSFLTCIIAIYADLATLMNLTILREDKKKGECPIQIFISIGLNILILLSAVYLQKRYKTFARKAEKKTD